LIVEDEPNMLAALEKGLKRDGYAIDIASTGEMAQELIGINEYDLIVLDINLPDIDGFTILKYLRENDPTTRVIIVSANRTIDDRIRGLDLGANDYLIKPFDFKELQARIRALLRRDFASKPNLMREGGLELDLSTHRVSYQEREIILTLKEYSILKYFVQNRGKIISSEELYQHIWNDEANPFTEVMRVHIYSLRKKLHSATGKNDIITTIKGSGYIFRIEE
jgi:DNA-binding response OmpR family regulator